MVRWEVSKEAEEIAEEITGGAVVEAGGGEEKGAVAEDGEEKEGRRE